MRVSFKVYISEAHVEGTIGHLEHIADRTFDGPREAHAAVNKVRGLAQGKFHKTAKIDDKVSFVVKRDHKGRTAVKYKGKGSDYNYSHEDIDKQHGHKPYLAGPLHHILQHAHKVLPHRAGEWQGGYMSSKDERKESPEHISHTPNTITYKAKKSSEEGKKLKDSHVSMTIHSEIENGESHPADHSEFHSHPDVHLVRHEVSKEERQIDPKDSEKIHAHVSAAAKALKSHKHDHHVGHEKHMREYINHTVRTSERPDASGFKRFQQSKGRKTEHIDQHKEAFDRSFHIHHHLQSAVNHLASATDRKGVGGFHTSIGGKPSGGEGYVARSANHIGKVVDRPVFSRRNFERSKALKANKAS